MRQLLLALRRRIRLLNRQRLLKRHSVSAPGYLQWVKEHDTLGEPERLALAERMKMLSNPPVISVLMSVCDADSLWLQQAIESVRNQLYPHWQLCIVDNASTNSAFPGVLAQAVASDSRIRLISISNRGQASSALNRALELAVQALRPGGLPVRGSAGH